MYKIYFGEKPFYIINKLDGATEALTKKHSTIMLNLASAVDIKMAVADLWKGTAKAVVLPTNKVEKTFQDLASEFEFIEAGGGLVKNENSEFLFIFRRGKWDLPKGKLDAGETIEQCAIREVMEETGIANANIMQPLPSTYHVYEEKGKNILKKSSWFLMQSNASNALQPQAAEDITQAVWLNENDFGKVLENTFPSVKDVISFVNHKDTK